MRSTEAMPKTRTFSEFAKQADYSLMDSLEADPQATDDGDDHLTREVFSGHYVPVTPTAISKPEYVTHSKTLFNELGLSQELALDELFRRLFSGDISVATAPMRPVGWATGYALSIYGTEYTQQCPFGTGNGYGDGRAISVFEGLFNGKRWEMLRQLFRLLRVVFDTFRYSKLLLINNSSFLKFFQILLKLLIQNLEHQF